MAIVDQRPMMPTLSGLEIEYRVVQLYSRDAGKREAALAFDVGQGTQDIGFRNALPVLFDCRPANRVRLSILDHDGKPAMAEFVIRDKQGRVYPARGRRLEPDFYFHDQIYREDGEELLLPAGKYDVTYSRGPEYLIEKREIEVRDGQPHVESFRLKRWIHMASRGWYFRRPSHSRGRLLALRSPHRRRAAQCDDATHPWGRSERRLRTDMGTVLVPPKAIL